MGFFSKKKTEEVIVNQDVKKYILALGQYSKYLEELKILFNESSTLFGGKKHDEENKKDVDSGVEILKNKWKLIIKMEKNFEVIFRKDVYLANKFNESLQELSEVNIDKRFNNSDDPYIMLNQINDLVMKIEEANKRIKNLIVEYTKKTN